MGKVACKLNLPTEARIHPVFHVSCLKKKLGMNTTAQPILPPIHYAQNQKPYFNVGWFKEATGQLQRFWLNGRALM